MVEYTSGSVTAKLTLDITGFKEATKEAENQAKTLKESLESSLNSGGVGDGLKSSLETLKKEFASLLDESKLLKSIDENLIKLTGSFGRVSKSAGNMSKETLTEFNKMQREATLLKDKLNTLFKTKVSNTNTMSTAEFDKINATLTKAGEQLSVFKGKTDSLVESANVTDSAFARWSGTIQKAETYISQLKAQMNSMNGGETAPKTINAQSINQIRGNLKALADAGHSFTLSLGEGFQRVDNSLINTNEKIARFIQYLSRTGDANLINSVANQLSTMQGKLDATNEASLRLVNTLRGMGEVTGVSIPLNGQMVELKGSMVATEESANELIMALRQLDPALIESFNLVLQNVKSNMAQIKAETEAVNQSFFKQNLAMDLEGLGELEKRGVFANNNTEAIERTKTQIKELIAYTKELGMTPLGNLNGELVSLDENLFQSGMRAESLDEILKTMSSPQLATLNEELGVTQSKLSGATADARLFKETLATMNIGAFNNVKTNFVSPENASIERTLSLIRQLQESYAQLGISSSVAFTDAEGKIVSFDGKLLQSREGLLILKEELSQLNASSLANLEMSLNRLNTRTKTLCDSTALYIDMLGNVKLNNIGVGKGDTANLKNMKQDIENVGKSSENTRKNLEGQKKSVNALDTAYGILRRTLSLIVVMFGFQLAMELFNVGKEAMDASYKIKTLGESMGWTAQQTQKFQSTANRLQKIYPKLDMNATAKSVMDMAKIYDMTNDEANNFIETAAVFNSAMIKEGRSTEDASLALKDYLDLGSGWSRRMSEIISDKQELIDTGYWDGETQDINAQIKALDAVLKKKHYHEMAKEIYTLDEAYRALQFRIGMFIGQGLQALTPYIISAVKGFLSLLDALDGIGNALKDNPLFQGVALFAGTVVAVGLLSKALSMLKLKIVETIASLASALVANPPLLAIAVTIGLIVTVVYELGKAWGWWKDIPSMLEKVGQALGTVQGQIVAVGSALAITIGYFAMKGWLSGADIIRRAVSNAITWLKEYMGILKETRAAEETTTIGGGKGKNGGINAPDVGDFKTEAIQNIKNIGMKFVKMSVYLAGAMLLITEAIALMVAPMTALAGVGIVFKGLEPQIRAGIEGLQLIAPVILAFTPPIALLMYASQFLSTTITGMLNGLGQAMGIIVAGLLLISVAIFSLVMPIGALAGLGVIANAMKTQVEQGIDAIIMIDEALLALVPVIPMFYVALGLGFAAINTELVSAGLFVGALVVGLGEIAIAIFALVIPLGAIAGLGALPLDMEGVKKGAEAIKQVSIALQYLSSAMGSIATIALADLATRIANFFNPQSWGGLVESMSNVDECIQSIETVASSLAKLKVPDINQEEIKKLGQVAEATKNIKSALDSISGIMNQGNIESGFKIDINDKGEINTGFIDIVKELKAKMGDINEFITAFNGIKVPAFNDNYTDKINRIKQVMEAVKQITQALKGIGDIGTSGGIAGGLSWVIWGDLASKYGILFQNIKSTVTFVRRVSQEIQTDNINGESINRLKNVISHIPYIVNTMNTVRTALNPVKDDAGVRDKFDIIKNNIIVVVNRVRDLLASVGDTSSINADSISRINNITQGVVNIVNKVKELRNALNGDEKGTDVNIGQKLGNIFLTLQYVQNFINAVMWNLGSSVGANGNISTVLSTFSNALSQVTGIASKVNSLITTLPEPTQDAQLQLKLYRLLQNIMVIKRFMSQVNWNVSKDGGAKGTGATEGMTKMVNDLNNAINSLAKTCDGAVKTLKGKGEAMGNAISNGFKGKVNDAKSAVSGLQKTIGSMASYACNRADDMSVHFNTTATRIRGVAVQVQNVIDKLNSLPSSKDVNVNVNYHTNGGGSGGGFNLPTFGLGLAGIKNTVHTGFGGVIRGLNGVKRLSAPVSGGFVDAFKSVIGGMRYSHYFGSKNNGNVTDTLNSGESNCVDGALATLQLARMFGLDGKLGTTMVNGEGHAFAIIEGKIFDATAMQLLGRTKAPNVRYSASNPTQKDKKKESKKEINIIVDMTDSTFYGADDFEKKAEKLFNRLALELLDVDKNDGV